MIMPSKERLNQMIVDYFSNNLPEQKLLRPLDLDSDKNKKRTFTLLHSNTLASTHMLVLVRKSLVPYISDIQSDQIAVGFGDMLSNKGAVLISFRFGKHRLLFINSHLAPHDEGLQRRNQ